jgi:hypothetical protein
MSTDNDTPGAGPRPRLSDEAAVEIHLFIYQFLELFEARYRDQIHRHYQDLSRDSLIEDNDLNLDDPPF